MLNYIALLCRFPAISELRPSGLTVAARLNDSAELYRLALSLPSHFGTSSLRADGRCTAQ